MFQEDCCARIVERKCDIYSVQAMKWEGVGLGPRTGKKCNLGSLSVGWQRFFLLLGVDFPVKARRTAFRYSSQQFANGGG